MSEVVVRLILVEGLPGSGKTTTAEALAEWLTRNDLAASWWREEDPEHPVTSRALKRGASRPGFAPRCVASWQGFVASARAGEQVFVLEGSAFQSTVRFMLEHEASYSSIVRYVRAFSRAVSSLEPCFIHLKQDLVGQLGMPGVGRWREAHARMLSWLVPEVTRSSAARRAARGWS